ncbi:MAG TPA: hypothetical protein VGU27_12695 [Candidatus Eisenbacteria bacterium]|nr:hypothetical protein [Candidatus Eisenbacteria bacterium]
MRPPAPRPPRAPRLAAAGIAVAAALLAAGCLNPFRPALPEGTNGVFVKEDFTTPDALLNTLSEAYAVGQSGATAYGDAFAESLTTADHEYRQVYDPGVLAAANAAHQLVPDPWDLTHERIFYSYMINLQPSDNLSLLLDRDPTSPNDDPSSQSPATFHRHYTLIGSPENGSRTDTLAIGYADITFYKNRGRWYIFVWNDRVDPAMGVHPANPTNKCMSQLRIDSQSSGGT